MLLYGAGTNGRYQKSSQNKVLGIAIDMAPSSVLFSQPTLKIRAGSSAC